MRPIRALVHALVHALAAGAAVAFLGLGFPVPAGAMPKGDAAPGAREAGATVILADHRDRDGRRWRDRDDDRHWHRRHGDWHWRHRHGDRRHGWHRGYDWRWGKNHGHDWRWGRFDRRDFDPRFDRHHDHWKKKHWKKKHWKKHKRWHARHHPRQHHWVGRHLPPGSYLVIRDFDDYLLPPPWRGHLYVRRDDDVFLIHEATRQIVGAFILYNAFR